MTERIGGRGRTALSRGRGTATSTAWLQFESLEQRCLLSADPLADVVAEPARFFGSGAGTPLNTVVEGLTPAQMQQAYGFNLVSLSSSTGSVVGNGAGQTIAIVDAYDDPNIAQDLHTFDQKFGLADPTLDKVEQVVNGRAPAANAGWAMEISLDVEWAHAMAPAANIMLVEANTSSLSNLLTSVQYAASQPGVSVVSMSWGASEFSSETSYDSYFTTPAGHTPVAFVASAGDGGAGALWPAASPNVLGVGGTTLGTTTSGTLLSESAWSDSGGGTSLYESEPTDQLGVQSSGKRETPDVAYDANPNTGFAIYDSVPGAGQAGWIQVGGTSAGAPQWAALIAIADQGLALKGQAAVANAPAAIYNLPASAFHDITTGSNGNAAGVGYDMVTGRGTPIANSIVADLVGPATATSAVVTHATVSPMRLLASSSSSALTFGSGEPSSAAADVSSVAMTLASISGSNTASMNAAFSTARSESPLGTAVADTAGYGVGSSAQPALLLGGTTIDERLDRVTTSATGPNQNLLWPAAPWLVAPGTLGDLGGQAVNGADLGERLGQLRGNSSAQIGARFDRGRSADAKPASAAQSQREWLPLVDACFEEGGSLGEATSSDLAFAEETSAAEVALIAAAVALASCWQVAKPAPVNRELFRCARRLTSADR